jgi:hypothetical protein
MVETEKVVELEYFTTSVTKSFNLIMVEEETAKYAQGKMGQSSANSNDSTNPNPETLAKPKEMKGQQQGHDVEEVLVEDIKNQSDSKGDEEYTTETVVKGHPIIGQKIKVEDTIDITLPYILDVVVIVEDMLKKVPKLRYSDHDVQRWKSF